MRPNQKIMTIKSINVEEDTIRWGGEDESLCISLEYIRKLVSEDEQCWLVPNTRWLVTGLLGYPVTACSFDGVTDQYYKKGND